MAKSAHWCCDPRRHSKPVQSIQDECSSECDLNAHFYGTEPQAVAKRERILAAMTKAEGHID